MRRTLAMVLGAGVLAACGGTPETSAPSDEASAAISAAILDTGAAAPEITATSPVRALVALAIHDSAGLDATIASLYAPSSASFRHYLTRAQLLAAHAPTSSDVATATAWLQSQGFSIARVSADNLFIEVDGEASAFDAAFNATLATATGTHTVAYTWSATPTATGSIASIITNVLAPDAPPAVGTPDDTGTVSTALPADPSESFLASQIAGAYAAQTLYAAGITGSGATIGIAGAGTIRRSDRQTFWQSQGITRTDATLQQVADAPASFNEEATLDVEWSGGLAPGANVIFYGAPDNHEGSLLYAVNEAVGNDAADVVSDSFAHHEAYVTSGIMTAYDTIGRFAAAMGITLLSAAGDSGAVDAPSTSPWFTAVGGTNITLAADGSLESEIVWSTTGCGRSQYEAAPAWQSPAVFLPEGKRAVADVSLQAKSLFLRWDGEWVHAGGTSFASPMTAGLIALVDSSRFAAGKPRAGYLNSILYATPSVQGAYGDVRSGSSGDHYARSGWDYPSGWGSTNAASLAAALP
jgi:kumamolisin